MGFLWWFFDPSLERTALQEFMTDLASGAIDHALCVGHA
jgi:hypothetical protein